MNHTTHKRLAGLVILCAAFVTPLRADDTSDDAPWWTRQKINFMWGQWSHARVDADENFWGDKDQRRAALLPRKLFANIAHAGATVFAEVRWYNADHARFAHEFGLKYFATLFVHDLHKLAGSRKAITQDGKPSHWMSPWCPLDEVAYENWFLDPQLQGVEQGLIDGIHVDWERYGGAGEAPICYCDVCFTNFPDFAKSGDALPDKAKRLAWVTERDLHAAYEKNFSIRRMAMFTRIREKLQAANPHLLFSSYGTVFSDFTRAMNTPKTPFVFLDSRHYINDDRQSWWESYGLRLRNEGYLYIPGGWTNALFGAQASQVSAARWIYEASINEDGCWLWFERELDDEILRAFATADRRIKAVLHKVGAYLLNGKRDPNFVTAVEWTGRPQLHRAVVHQTHHLGDEHLVHVSNVNTEWPMRIRLRFPRIAAGDNWTVRDAMYDLYHTSDGSSATWTSDELKAGVVVTLEPRSDIYLVLSRSAAKHARFIRSREFDALPDHATASRSAGLVKKMIKPMNSEIYGDNFEALLSKTKKIADVPSEGWRFKMDAKDVGYAKNWHLPATPADDWIAIATTGFWGDKGGTGYGWYRRDVDIPALPDGERVYLHFGAVDEWLALWIDGQYAGDYTRVPGEGWDKPFALDVTGKLAAGKHHIAMRVYNVAGAGGVWKPIALRVGPGAAPKAARDVEGAAGQLLYTAAEPMGYGGPEGSMTIGNAVRAVDVNWKIGPRLRQLRGHLWSPSYSPDGQRIAFVHNAGGRGQIFVMNADGSSPTNLSNNQFCDRSPRWSPNGKSIAFVSDRAGDWDIYTVNADGSGQRCIASNQGLDLAPTWSPNSKQIAWESHVSGTPNIWIANAANTNDTSGGARPLIAKDNKPTVNRHSAGSNAVFNFVEIEWPFADNTFYLMNPVWSPTDNRIAAVLLGAYGSRAVVTIEADGSQIDELVKEMPGADHLAWSPDGKHFAGTWRTAPQETERAGIFVVSADGKNRGRQGKWLVDVTPQGPRLGGARRHGLVSWYSHGSALPRRVVKTFLSPSWSPDGRTIAFCSDMAQSGAFYVYTIPAQGGEPTRIEITRSAWPQQVTWRPR